MFKMDYTTLTTNDLRKICKLNGLKVYGLKHELVSRLTNHYNTFIKSSNVKTCSIKLDPNYVHEYLKKQNENRVLEDRSADKQVTMTIESSPICLLQENITKQDFSNVEIHSRDSNPTHSNGNIASENVLKMDYTTLTTNDLRKICKSNGLKVYGLKHELVSRLTNYYNTFIKSSNVKTCSIKLDPNYVHEYLKKQNENRVLEDRSADIQDTMTIESRPIRTLRPRLVNVARTEDIKTQKRNLKTIDVPSAKRQRLIVSKKVPMKRGLQKNALIPAFHQFELVWAYVRGFPYWPGVIEMITPNGRYLVHFFGDFTKAEIPRNNIRHFFEGFSQFGQPLNNIKLKKAVEEAQIFLFSLNNESSNECFICKMLLLKHTQK